MIHKILKIDLSDDKMIEALEEFLSKVGEDNVELKKESKKEERKDYSSLLGIEHPIYSIDDITKKDVIKVLVKNIVYENGFNREDAIKVIDTLKVLNKLNSTGFSLYLLDIIAALYYGIGDINDCKGIYIIHSDYTIEELNDPKKASFYPSFTSKEEAVKALKLIGISYVEK